ncbi:MAG: hypothetical protein QM749_12205 [Aquabacterium sp.]
MGGIEASATFTCRLSAVQRGATVAGQCSEIRKSYKDTVALVPMRPIKAGNGPGISVTQFTGCRLATSSSAST